MGHRELATIHKLTFMLLLGRQPGSESVLAAVRQFLAADQPREPVRRLIVRTDLIVLTCASRPAVQPSDT